MQARKRGRFELDGALVPRDGLVDVAELLFIESGDSLSERDLLGPVVRAPGERLQSFDEGLEPLSGLVVPGSSPNRARSGSTIPFARSTGNTS